MSDCEEKIYSNDYVDFIISKDVLDVIDLSSDCIQRIDEEKDTYFYPRSFFRIFDLDRKSTRLNSSHANESRMPSSA